MTCYIYQSVYDSHQIALETTHSKEPYAKLPKLGRMHPDIIGSQICIQYGYVHK